MRRGIAFGLLALGVLVVAVPGAAAQTTTSPTTASSIQPTTTLAATEPTATTRVVPTAVKSGRSITAGGEGFPWIPVGIGILVAGLIGSRLRRASRR